MMGIWILYKHAQHYLGTTTNKDAQETDNTPTIGEWEETLPRWKYFFYSLSHRIPLVRIWALSWFGYSKAKRTPSLKAGQALCRREIVEGVRQWEARYPEENRFGERQKEEYTGEENRQGDKRS